jgi:hypothetical protein
LITDCPDREAAAMEMRPQPDLTTDIKGRSCVLAEFYATLRSKNKLYFKVLQSIV